MNEMNYENRPELSKKEQKRLAREEKRNDKADVKAAKKELSKHNGANPFRPTFRWDGSKRHRTAKRVLGLLLALALTVSVTAFCIVNMDALPGFFSSFLPNDNLSEGYCGSEETNDVVRWKLSSAGVLTISGKGEMQAYNSFAEAPWASKADEIKTISIGDEVEWVSLVAFSKCKNLEFIRVSEKNASYAESANGLYSADFATLYLYPAAARSNIYTVVDGTTHISDGAFSENPHLETVSLPASLVKIGSNAFLSCAKLKNVIFSGNAAAWEKLSASLVLAGNVKVEVNESGAGAVLGLTPEHSYEYLAVSPDVTRGENAVLLSDGSTVFLDAGDTGAYLEVTIPCERAGVYGLTMKEYHSVGRLNYVTLVNRSVVHWSDITSGARYPELSSEVPEASTLSPEDYAVPVSVVGGNYTEYYAYTYLKAGMNRVRIALRADGKQDYDIGINAFRFDLISADTENTETVFATDPTVVDHFKPGQYVGRNPSGMGSFYRTKGSFDVNINIKKEATYDVYLMTGGTITKFWLWGSGEEALLSSAEKITVGGASNALVPLHLGATTLSAGEQTLTFEFEGSTLNLGMIRLVPQGEDPLGKQAVETELPGMSLGDGELDLVPSITPLGTSVYTNGAFKLQPGIDNALKATVTVEKGGVYALRLRGVFEGEYFLRNMKNDMASLFVTANADTSLGWQVASDGYGNYTVYQYLFAGENTLEFWSSDEAWVEGMKLVPLTEDEPTLLLLSTNVSGATASASSSYYWSKIMQGDTLTYELRVTEAGEYLLSGLIGGPAANIVIYDAEGKPVRTLDYDPAPTPNREIGIMGNGNAVVYAEMTSVTLPIGEYKIVVTGMTAAASHYSQLYLTKKDASESGVVWANIDLAPAAVTPPTEVKKNEEIDIAATQLKVTSKSGIALNGSLLIYGGKANGVYFNVNAAEAGFYQVEFAMAGRNMSAAYARLYNPAVTGEMCSTNRDSGLGNTRNEEGYSPYGYYVYLAKGQNQIYFEHDGGEDGYYEVVAARFYKVAFENRISSNYAATLAVIEKSSTVSSFGAGVAQLRPAGYGKVTENQRAVYEFTPSLTGDYQVGLFLAGVANVNLRVYEGTGEQKQLIANAVKADGSFVGKFDEGVSFTVTEAITFTLADAKKSESTAKFKIDGSSYMTTFAPGVALVTLEKDKTYTFELECGDGSSYLNAGTLTLAYTEDETATLASGYPSVKQEDLKTDNMVSAPSDDTTTFEDLYDGAMVEQLVETPAIKGDDLILTVIGGHILPKSDEDYISNSYGIMINSDVTVAVNAEKTGIYKIVLSAFTGKDVFLTVSANGVSSMITCVADKTGAENGDDAADRSYYEAYVYLAEGDNNITLSAEGLALYAVLVRGVEEVQTPAVHRNFFISSPLPDNGNRPEGYYILREGDTVGVKEAYISVDAGFKWVSAFVGGEGYLTYTFKNIDTEEETSVTYDLTKALEGQKLGTMDLGYASFGYVKLSEGRYTVTVSLAKGSYALITASFLAAETHTHVYDMPGSKEPTCVVDGARWNECFCGAIDKENYEVLPATGTHDYELVIKKEPTCVDFAEYAEKCKHCGYVAAVHNTQELGTHEYTEWAVVEPTLTAEGSAERHCIHCGDTETRQIAKKHSRYESISIDVTKITLEDSNKVLKFSCSVSQSGFYQIRMNTLLTPEAGKEAETYITARSEALPGYSSIGKSYLNEQKTAYEFSTGLSVYLKAGENTVTLTAAGAFDAAITELTLVNQSGTVDSFALCEPIMNFGKNFPNNKQAELRVTIEESGFYSVGYLMGIPGKTDLNVSFKRGEESVLTYSVSFADAASVLPEGITGVVGSTDATQYIEGGYIYLEAGEYSITVTPQISGYFCFAGMTFAFADPIPSVDDESGSSVS